MNDELTSLCLRRLLARNLRDARSRAGLAQEALALKVGLSATYVSQIESGSRSVTLTTLQKLADGVELPPWRLIFDEGAVGEEPAPDAPRKAARRRI